jgi:hypothetical protein
MSEGLKMNTVTPIQRRAIIMAFKGQCVSCLNAFDSLWNADGFALTDESTSDGFCHSCWNY